MRGLAATAAGGRRVTAVAAVAVITATAAVVEDQDDRNDEQKPRAVNIAAKQITQTHTVFLLSESRVQCFHCHTMTPPRLGYDFLKNRENARNRE